ALAEQFGGVVVVHRIVDLLGRPDVERAFFSFTGFADALGVERAEKPTLGMLEFAFDESERLAGDLAVALLSKAAIAIDIRPNEFGVVIKHLLEVGHGPLAVGGIAMKAAANVVAESAVSHRIERFAGYRAELVVVGAFGGPHQEVEPPGLGELLAATESAVFSICVAHGTLGGGFEQIVSGDFARILGCVLQFVGHRARPLVGTA